MSPGHSKRLVGGTSPASPAPASAEGSGTGAPEERPRESPWDSPDPLPEIPCLDALAQAELSPAERALLARLAERVARGGLSLTRLPATSMTLINRAVRSTAGVADVVAQVERDPVLCSELLRVANSVAHGNCQPTTSVRDAVMRLGTRNLQTLILGLSMRSGMLRSSALQAYGEKVWRQAFTVASLARSLAPKFGMDPDTAFLLGLLHDIGKLALLDTLSKEHPDGASPALVGRLFADLHERAGALLARAWRLPAELVSVAGRHHDYRSNREHPREAALVSLAHTMHLHLSQGALTDYDALAEGGEMAVFGVYPEVARTALADGLEMYFALHPRTRESAGEDEAA